MNRKTAKALRLLMTDRCDVYRASNVSNGSITAEKWDCVYSAVPCRVSQRQLRHSGQTDTVNIIDYDTKLFLPSGYRLKPSDAVKVTRCGEEIWYASCGEPFIYPTHGEHMLRRRDRL